MVVLQQGTPWIGVNPNFTFINAKNQINDPNSIYQYYRKLIKLRKDNEVIVYGDFTLLLPKDDNIFAYVRTLNNERIVVLCNFYSEEVSYQLPKEYEELGEVMISNYDSPRKNKLRPYEAYMYRVVKK